MTKATLTNRRNFNDPIFVLDEVPFNEVLSLYNALNDTDYTSADFQFTTEGA